MVDLNNSSIDQLQRALSIAQAVPFFGPLIVSDIKSCVSLAQVVMGAALTVFGICKGYISSSVLDGERIKVEGMHHLYQGCGSLLYSMVSKATFGLAGFVIEVIRYTKSFTAVTPTPAPVKTA